MDEFIELVDENLEDEINYENSKADKTLGDVILIQLILCVILIIALAVLNLIKPEMTNNILFDFKQNIDKVFEYKGEIGELISKITGSVNV